MEEKVALAEGTAKLEVDRNNLELDKMALKQEQQRMSEQTKERSLTVNHGLTGDASWTGLACERLDVLTRVWPFHTGLLHAR